MEGGRDIVTFSLSPSCLDPRDFGGYFDGQHHYRADGHEWDGVSIQMAIEALPTSDPANLGTGQGGMVLIPDNGFVSYPIQIDRPNVALSSLCQAELIAAPMQNQPRGDFPVILARGKYRVGMPTAPSLVSGPGAAWRMTGDMYSMLSLSDCYSMLLQAANSNTGLPAFTIRCFVEIDAALPLGDYVLFTCHGGFGAPMPRLQTLDLSFHRDSTGVYLALDGTIGGAPLHMHSYAAPRIGLGVAHHLAICYDGTHVTIYVDGASVATGIAAGNLKPSNFEDFVLGPGPGRWALGSLESKMILGAVDSFEFNDASLYSGPFTPPTAKHTQTATTRFLCNFDDLDATGTIVGCQTALGKSWLYFRSPGQGGGSGQMHDVTISNLKIEAGNGVGIIAEDVQGLFVENVYAHGLTALSMEDGCFEFYVRNFFGFGFKHGIRTYGNISVGAFNNIRLRYTTYGCALLLTDTYGISVRDFYAFGCNAFCVIHGDNVSLTLDGFAFGDENSAPPEYGLVLVGTNNVTITGLRGWFSSATPLMTVAGGDTVTLIGPQLISGATNPPAQCLIAMPAPPAKPVKVIGYTGVIGGPPLALNPSTVQVI